MRDISGVNERLEKGQGWIGHRNNGGVPSKYLYFAFYRNGKQVFVNTKSNDPEEVYRQLLEAREATERGVMVLPTEAARLTYEHLRTKYINEKPSRAETEKSQLFYLDKFFAGKKAAAVTTDTLREYIKRRGEQGVAGPTIRRELTNLRAMFNLARKERVLSFDQVPYFPMPKDSLPAGQYIHPRMFQRILTFLPDGTKRMTTGRTSESDLRPLFAFLYGTACRVGAARRLKRTDASEDGTYIEIPAALTKTKQKQLVMLSGDQLKLVREHIMKHPRNDSPLFDSANYQEEWARACAKAGLGAYDEETHRRTGGVRIHDCRCSGAVNLLASGVPESTVLKIGGWVSRATLDRYNVMDMTRLAEAMEQGSKYVTDRTAHSGE
jgi:integrase